MKTLKKLYQAHQGKASDKWSIYLETYERLFAPLTRHPINLLEIGIQNGGSLEIWSKYFTEAQNLVGCDVNKDCATLKYSDPRIHVVIGDANNSTTQTAVLEKSTHYDIIIDDGSHTSSDIIRSFANYFPYLKDGGLYIAEDLHCSYWKEYGGGLYFPYSSITFFKQLADIINHEHWANNKNRSDYLTSIAKHWGTDWEEPLLSTIHSIEFTNSICVVRKMPPDQNKLGKRIVSGLEENAVAGIRRLSHRRSEPPSQLDNPWSIMTSSPAEQWPDIVTQLENSLSQSAKLRHQIEVLTSDRDHLAQLLITEQTKSSELERKSSELEMKMATLRFSLNAIKQSTSWRLTSPIRYSAKMLAKLPRVHGLIKTIIQSYGLRRAIQKSFDIWRHEGWNGLQQRLAPNDIQPNDLAEYADWYNTRYRQPDFTALSNVLASSTSRPRISIIMPVFRPDATYLTEAIKSVIRQTYPDWELCIVDDASDSAEISNIITNLSLSDQRIKYSQHRQNRHISATSNSAIELSSGDYVVLLDHDDVLPEHALATLAKAIVNSPDVEFFYSDEDRIDKTGQLCRPFFKPDWSPALLWSQNYITHLACFKRELLDKTGPFHEGYEGAQDHDLFLRLTDAASNVRHIPEILYHWREHAHSTSLNSDSKPYAHGTGLKAVDSYLKKRYPNNYSGTIDSRHTYTYSPRFTVDNTTRISIIIPTRDKAHLLRQCIDSILKLSTWNDFEIIIIDNQSSEPEILAYFEELDTQSDITLIPADFEFNWSKVNNLGVDHASGDILVFLNNDVEIITPDWLERLASYALLPDVAAVGPLLLYGNGLIQHAGVVVGMNGWADHVFKGLPPHHHIGPFVSPEVTRNVLAVTGACTVIEKRKFLSLGKFDEDFIICGSDVELCLRAVKAGYQNVYTPDARLYHHESMSRGSFVPENDFHLSEQHYAPYRTKQTDPFFNLHLDLFDTTPRLRHAHP